MTAQLTSHQADVFARAARILNRGGLGNYAVTARAYRTPYGAVRVNVAGIYRFLVAVGSPGALDALARKGLLEAHEVRTARSTVTCYTLTDEGRARHLRATA